VRRRLRRQVVAAIGSVALLLVLAFVPHPRPGSGSPNPASRIRPAAIEPELPPYPSEPRASRIGEAHGPPAPSRSTEAIVAIRPLEIAEATLRVAVVDPWERPLGGGWIVAWPLRFAGDAPLRVAVDDEGFAEIRLTLGVPHRLDAFPRSLDDPRFEPSSLEPVFGDAGEVTVRLGSKACRVSGRVLAAESGEPLSRFALSYRTEGQSGGGTAGAPGGTFDELLYLSGNVTLTIAAGGRAPETRVVRLAAGGWIRDLEFRLAALPAATLRGRVVSEDGTAVGGAEVVLASLTPYGQGDPMDEFWSDLGHTATDESGRFAFGNVPLGRSVVEVRKEYFAPTGRVAFRMEGEGQEVEIVLIRAGRLRIRGRLPDGTAGTPDWIRLRKDGALVLKADRSGVEAEGWHSYLPGGGQVESYDMWGGIGEPCAVDEEGFLVIDGVLSGEYEATVLFEGLEGRTAVRVVAGETAEVEAILGKRRG